MFLCLVAGKNFSRRHTEIVFIFFLQKIGIDFSCKLPYCCGYSLEVPSRSASDEYPQHDFMENWSKFSSNYHQILFLNNSSALETVYTKNQNFFLGEEKIKKICHLLILSRLNIEYPYMAFFKKKKTF